MLPLPFVCLPLWNMQDTYATLWNDFIAGLNKSVATFAKQQLGVGLCKYDAHSQCAVPSHAVSISSLTASLTYNHCACGGSTCAKQPLTQSDVAARFKAIDAAGVHEVDLWDWPVRTGQEFWWDYLGAFRHN